jgi:ferredoxin-nitrite reductase
VHAQKQPGLNWIGVVLPVGKLTVAQMRGLAKLARDLGDGDIRLTVWQNLLISGVPTKRFARPRPRSRRSASRPGDSRSAPASSPAPATGCRFAASDTKRTPRSRNGARRASQSTPGQHPPHRLPPFLRAALHRRHRPDRLQGAPSEDEDDPVEGYHIHVGGGFGPDAAHRPRNLSRREGRRRAAAVERMLAGYLANRASRDETFLAFTRRHEIPALTLKALFEAEAAE